MKTQEFPLAGKTKIDVILEEETVGIEEVVAIGYGTARRKDITGSINSIKMEDSPIAIAPNFNALSSLKGTTPGVNIGTVNNVGETPTILIRGQNSISGSNDPLIVLDGVVYLGSLNDINPNDIATFDILKDASSTAVYGSRAANGVIIITSKKGKTAKPTIRLNTSTGVSVWQQKPDLESPERFLQKYMDQQGVSDPLDLPNLLYIQKNNYLAGKTTNWLDVGSRIGLIQKYNISISGSGKGLNYFISTGYNQQEGVIIGDDYKQASLRGKIDTDITAWLEIGVDGSYNYGDYSGIGADLFNIQKATPYSNVYFDEENKIFERFPYGQSAQNGLWDTDKSRVEDVDHRNFYRLFGYANIKIPFVKGLNYRLSYVRNNNVNNTERFYNESYFIDEMAGEGIEDTRYNQETLQGKLTSANGYIGRRIVYNYVIDNVINYKKQVKDHYLNATLVATRDYSHDKYVQADGSNFAANGNTALGVNGLHKAEIQSNYINVIETSNIAYLARLGYSFLDKYHLTASYRRDGSSVFGADKKWGDFPSIGLAWTTSKEKFLQSVKFLDYLKIRASYGKNGNQGISAYNTLTTIKSAKDGNIMYEFSNDPSKLFYGLAIASLGNSFLGWETTTAFNSGFESVFLRKRILFDLDFYFSNTSDQLFNRQIPIMTGFSSIKSSMGKINNHGIELSLTTVNVKNQNLMWSSNLTFWQNRNILKELYGDDNNGDGIEDDDIGNSLFIGKSLGAIYGYEADGIVQEDDTEYITTTGAKPGDVRLKDISGPDGVPDGKLSPEYDRKILGYNKENFRLNLSNTFKYKDVECYILISGIFGGGKDNYYILDNQYAFMMNEFSNRTDYNHPYWTPENKNNTYPSTRYYDARYLGIQSRTFVRIQDLTISYSFNQPWVNNRNIQSFKLYAAIQNLYTFTGWDGGDPEEGVRALSKTYPVPTTYSIGLDISF
jgi:TonB-linked SusC/RagA family outer membrane protein